MSESEIGILYIVVMVIGGAWAILTFCIPFMLYSILQNVKRIADRR